MPPWPARERSASVSRRRQGASAQSETIESRDAAARAAPPSRQTALPPCVRLRSRASSRTAPPEDSETEGHGELRLPPPALHASANARPRKTGPLAGSCWGGRRGETRVRRPPFATAPTPRRRRATGRRYRAARESAA